MELAAANYCGSPADCFDMGQICPFECHVPVNTDSEHFGDVSEAVSVSRAAMYEGRCSIDCSAPFYGFECIKNRCVPRSQPPSRPICFGIDGGEADCGELLTRRNLWGKCLEFCDGAVPTWEWNGRRLQPLVRVERGNGEHDTYAEIVDFYPCALCPSP